MREFKLTEIEEAGIIPASMQTETISIAVAVYNGEAYLHRCVNSLLAQTYRKLEIILVDDGSTDESPRICDEYAARDPRVKVVHKKNGGLASGRNAGIEHATGTYMAFFDEDDWAEPQMYEHLLWALKKYEADVAVTRYRWVYQDGTAEASTDAVILMEGQEALEQYIHENDAIQIQNAAWNKLYPRALIGDLRFEENRWYEDVLYTTKLLAKVNKVIYLDQARYNYVCDRPGSYMNQGVSSRILTDLIPIYRDRSAFLASIGREDLACLHNTFFYKRMLQYYRQAAKSGEAPEEKARKMRQLREEILREKPDFDKAYAAEGVSPNERRKMNLFLLSPKLYLLAMDLDEKWIVPLKQKLK
ncbi:MAG: glycosyltransferase [Lachnospiraceae bacterium]|nr:glycosyltransferase [Lachnospiraceae bacterium]